MKNLEAIEKERQHEQARLDLFMGMAERNRTGQFATPQALTRDIAAYARQLWRGRPVRFLEPALGTGSFFSALLHVFPPGSVEAAAGFEVDPWHVEVARALWKGTGLKVRLGDFTTQRPPRKGFNLLMTNPPYVRHHHIPGPDKSRLKTLVAERLGLQVSGLMGLYCYFLLLCDPWVEEGALSVWLIPSEFMDVNPADVQFDDALVSSAVVVFEKFTLLRAAAGHQGCRRCTACRTPGPFAGTPS